MNHTAHASIRFWLASAVLLLTLTVSARPIRFGVEGGLDIRNMNLRSSVFDLDNRTGWFVGPKAALDFPLINLQVDGAILYNQRQMGFLNATTAEKNTKEMSYLLFPVNVRYTFRINRILGIYVSTGPQWRRYLNKGNYVDMIDDLSLRVDRSTLSWNVGVGVDVAKYVQLGVTYNMGIDSEYWVSGISNTVSEFDASKNSWQLRLSCLF